MDAERSAQIKALFDEVCELAEPVLSARLSASGADAAVIERVRALLEQEGAATQGIDAPLGDAAGDDCEPGDLLGVWKLERRIGRGGMGSVYLARRSDGHYEQTAAVKVLRGIPSVSALQYLARERQILAKLSHPNIARLLDGGATRNGQPFLVMEYLDAVPIDQYCEEQKLPAAAILRLLLIVCEAVGFAHQRLIVHCDLKPSNILVDATGRPWLLDFGIARLLEHGATEARSSERMRAFTPGYASPEQRAGGVVSTATDIYSLGSMLVELLGEGEWTQADDVALDPNAIPDGELRAIAAKATSAEPAQRYATADALAKDIERYLKREPLQALTHSPLYIARKFVQRRWPWVATTALFMVTVAAFTLRVVQDRDRAELAEHNALLERDRAVQAQASARQISQFLVSVFEGSDPDAGSGEIPTSKLVEQALTRIDTELKGQPATQAELFSTLAGVQMVLGNPEASRNHYNHAIEIQRTLNQPLVLAEMLSARTVLLKRTFGKEDAEADAREALALNEKYAAPDSSIIAASLNLLGTVLSESRKYAEAEPLLLRARAIYERIDTPGLVMANMLDSLASHYLAKGDFEQAVANYRRSLELQKALFGERSTEYVATLESLGNTYARMRRFDEAEPLLRQSLEVWRELSGSENVSMAWHLSQFGRMLDNAGRSNEAIPLYREALTIGAKKMGVDSVSYAVLLNNLAVASRRIGDYATAIKSYEQALPLMRKYWPANDPTLARVHNDFGTLLVLAGKVDAARAPLFTAYEARVATSGEHSVDATLSSIDVAEWERRSGHVEQAWTRLQKIAADVTQLEPLAKAGYSRQLGLAKAARGDLDGGLVDLQQSEQLTREALGERDPRTWLSMLDRAELLAARGSATDRDAAAALGREILAGIGESQLADSPPLRRLQALR